MSPEWLTAIGTIGTFAVIAASAVAALIQIRHLRSSNQIIALTEMRETLYSPAFQAALRFLNHDFPRLLEDPQNRKKLSLPGPIPPEFEQVRTVAGFFEQTGTFVKRGIIDADTFLDLWGEVVISTWHRLAPYIISARLGRGQPAMFENFEYIAALTEQFSAKHPGGTYPANMPRLTADPWPEAQGPLRH